MSIAPRKPKAAKTPKLTPMERKIIELRLDPQNSLKDIGDVLGRDQSTVHLHLHKPHVQEELKRRSAGALDAARQRLKEVVPDLVDLEIQIAAGKQKADREQRQALKTVLDRAGLAPVEEVNLGGGLDLKVDYAAKAATIRNKLRPRSA